jgi:GTPase SAR1 family protein
MEVPDILNFKIIVVGHQGTFSSISGVGKSSLVSRYIKGEFLDNYNVTVGVEYSTKIVHP